MWLPNAERVTGARSGEAYRLNVPWKLVLHTTETSGFGSMPWTHPWPPHLWYDPNTRKLYQGIDTERTGYALARKGATETNHARAIQVEIIGRAAETQNYSDTWYRNLAEDIILPVCNHHGIPLQAPTFYGTDAGFSVASRYAPQRLSPSAWYAYHGVIGHQHVPDNDHWDPGKFNWARLAKFFQEDDMFSDDDRELLQANRMLLDILTKAVFPEGVNAWRDSPDPKTGKVSHSWRWTRENIEAQREILATIRTLAEAEGVVIDTEALAVEVAEELRPAIEAMVTDLSDADLSAIAKAVVDEHRTRLGE